MSSHHIIRDEQEPALLIIDSEACSLDLIQQLLGWSPTLVVVEPALDQVLNWGIKIDVVICLEEQRDTVEAKTANQFPIKIITTNGSLAENGLRYLYEHNHSSVHVISYFEDEHFAQSFLEKMDVIVFNQEYKGFYVAKGTWKKWVTTDTLFQVLPLANDASFETNNLVSHSLKNADISVAPNKAQSFRPGQEGFIQISNPNHPFWVFEKIQ